VALVTLGFAAAWLVAKRRMRQMAAVESARDLAELDLWEPPADGPMVAGGPAAPADAPKARPD
jgi:hypothetical protein